MSHIERLEIKGIRAFSHAKLQYINFGSPLTLIVGHNGCGKTTIIESLRYAATGSLPPGTDLRSFGHDPELVSEPYLSASIRLAFIDSRRARVTASRRLEVKSSKGIRSCSAIEASITQDKGNGDLSRSSVTVKEMDVRMPAHLGVNKAVLDNVIFCHQEDSLWPLGKARDVKFQFDALFESDKYYDAIKNIKAVSLEKKAELKIHIVEANAAKVRKDDGKDIWKRCEALTAEIEEGTGTMNNNSRRIKEVETELAEAGSSLRKANEIAGQLSAKRIQAQTMQQNISSLRTNLQELAESDEELNDMLANYEERVAAYQRDHIELMQEAEDLDAQIEQKSVQAGNKQREQGSLEAEERTYRTRVEERRDLAKQAADQHSIRGFSFDDESQLNAFLTRMNKLAQDRNATYDRVKQETASQLQESSDKINSIRQEITESTSRKSHARQLVASSEEAIQRLQRSIDAIKTNEGTRAVLDADLAKLKERLQSAKAHALDHSRQEQQRQLEHQIREAEDRVQELQTELAGSSKYAHEVAQVQILEKKLVDDRQSLQTLRGAHGDKIASFIGDDWQPSTAQALYQDALDQSKVAVQGAEQQRDKVQQELNELDFKLRNNRSEQQRTKQRIDIAAKTVSNAIVGSPADYLAEVAELEMSREDSRTGVEEYKAAIRLYRQSIDIAEKHAVCRTCTQKLTQAQIVVLRKNMEQELEKSTSKGTGEKALLEIEKELAAARAVSADHEEWQRLTQKELPKLTAEKTQLDADRTAVVTRLETCQDVVNDKYSFKREVESISQILQSITTLPSSIAGYEKEIRDLNSKLKDAGSFRTVEVIQKESDKARTSGHAARSELDDLKKDKAQADQSVSNFELQVRDTISELADADHKLKDKMSLQSQVDEQKQVIAAQKDTIRTADIELERQKERERQAQAVHDAAKAEGQNREREMQSEAAKIRDTVHRLDTAGRDIKGYLERGAADLLRGCKKELTDLRDEINELVKNKAEVIAKDKTIENRLRDHNDTKRSIHDNLTFRQSQRSLQTIRAEIVQLEARDAEREVTALRARTNALQLQQSSLAGDNAALMGRLRAKDEELQEAQLNLETKFKGAHNDCREAHIKVETTKACISDLDTYAKALDKAVLKFHVLKLQDVNETIDDLWRKTYQGSDVDTIFIKSDNEIKRANATYNYRVVMRKNNTEMDMRGRCSAGQKVLACIIIRLALAEVFGSNCGLIALDEPTTNLDRENSHALAQALAELIKIRKNQSNFQIVIITHDEEFLQAMNPSDYADVYWRVSRNDDQNSVINCEPISRLM